MVTELKVFSDHAERGVVLIQEYCGLMTKDEQQLQFLLKNCPGTPKPNS